MQKMITGIYLLFVIQISVFSQNHTLELSVGVSSNRGLNLYSENGYISPIVAKNRIFPVLGINSITKRKNLNLNTLTLASHFTGHTLIFDNKLFPGKYNFHFKAYYFSMLLGYCHEWPLMNLIGKDHGMNNLYFGIGANMNVLISQRFQYSADTIISNTGKVLYTSNKVISPVPKQMLNTLLQVRYFIRNKNQKVSSNLCMQYMIAFGNTYRATYAHNYGRIPDNLIMANRGHIFNLIYSVALRSK